MSEIVQPAPSDVCQGCGKTISPNALSRIRVISGFELTDYQCCAACAATLSVCVHCNGYLLPGIGAELEEQTYCPGCYHFSAFACVQCGEMRSRITNRAYPVRGSERALCDSCFDSFDWRVCGNCGYAVPSEEATYSDYNNCYYCETCYDNEGEETIHDYGYKPNPIFFGSGIHYGVELEVAADENCASETLAILGADHIYLKDDSSIQPNGYEIVTHPHTLSEHRKLWDRFFASLPQHIDRTNTRRNGLHVHIERSKLTALQIQKMLVFLNAPEHINFVIVLAERDCSRWAAIKTGLAKLTAYGGDDRYQALNLCPRRTVEIRIFRSTVKAHTFFKALEFCDALVAFTRDRSYRDLGYRSFCAFVRQNRKSYLNLDNFLVATGYLAPASKPRAMTAAA